MKNRLTEKKRTSRRNEGQPIDGALGDGKGKKKGKKEVIGGGKPEFVRQLWGGKGSSLSGTQELAIAEKSKGKRKANERKIKMGSSRIGETVRSKRVLKRA